MNTSIVIDEVIDEKYISDRYGLIDPGCFNYEYKNIDIIKQSKIKCITCGNYTPYAIRIDNEDSDIYHYECRECDKMYAVCFRCEDIKSGNINLAQLISHENFKEIEENGHNYEIVKDETDPNHLFVDEIVYTKPTYFFDQTKFGPITGDDGGYMSTWKCNCSTLSITDK